MAAAAPPAMSKCGSATQAAATWTSGTVLKSSTVNGCIAKAQVTLNSSKTLGSEAISTFGSLPRIPTIKVDRNAAYGIGCDSHQQQSRGRRNRFVQCTQSGDTDPGTVPGTTEQGQQPGASKNVLVFGAAGGVGQLIVASLLEKGAKVRAVVRNAEKAKSLFGEKLGENFEFRVRDVRQPEALDASVVEGVTHVIIVVGTTAFPSKRWFGNNGPEQTDLVGKRNIIDALPKTVQRVVLVSSIGVTRYNRLPFNILNLFGVLKYKKMSEDYLEASGLPFTIIRPSRLTGSPFTAYDLSTLLKITSESRKGVLIGQGDEMVGDAERSVVAEACVQALDLQFTAGQAYELSSVEGSSAPGKDLEKWRVLFEKASSPALQSA